MLESSIQNRIRLALARFGIFFRNNVGTGWQGKSKRNGNFIIIENPRPLHAGLCVGSSDIIGIHPVQITPEMVGKTVGVFCAIEVKTDTGKPTPEQVNFIKRIRQHGGIAEICRSDDEIPFIFESFRGV